MTTGSMHSGQPCAVPAIADTNDKSASHQGHLQSMKLASGNGSNTGWAMAATMQDARLLGKPETECPLSQGAS
jgi:hypothetical protein